MKPLFLLAALLALPSARGESPFPYVSVNGCSGVIVRPAGATSSQSAVLLTNAHCLDFRPLVGGSDSLPPAGKSFWQISKPAFLEKILASVQTAAGRLTLRPQQLLFASMSGTDLAVVELKETYGALTQAGAEPVALASSAALPGTHLRIEAGFYNRRFECDLGDAVVLKEGPYRWPRAFRLGRGCEIYPGVSGAPVLEQSSGRLLGLANTHYSGDGALCSFHNPCEIIGTEERAGAVDQSYAVRIDDLAGCFAPNSGSPDFTQPSCPHGESHANEN